MPSSFLQLFPFVFTGVLLGTFFPVPTGRGTPPTFSNTAGNNPPPGVVNDINNRSGLPAIIIRFMVTLWDAIYAIYDPSTTSRCGNFPHTSAPAADARTKFLSITRMHGWTGFDGTCSDGLSMLGPLSSEGLATTRAQLAPYIQHFVGYTLMDILSRRDDTVLSPAVLNEAARNFPVSFNTLPVLALSATLQLDDEDAAFLVRTFTTIASLVIALLSRVENEQAVRLAFNHFIEDPRSWIHFAQSYGPYPSVEQIARETHRGSHTRGSSRILTVGPPGPSTSIFNAGLGREGPHIPDVEAGMGPISLRDEELEYFAALFVAAFMRFHRTSSGAIRRTN